MANWVEDFLEQNPAAAARKIARRTRRGIHFAGDGRQRTAFISGAPVHFFDRARREWREIDTELRQDGAGMLGGAGVQIRMNLDGEARLEGHGYRQRAARVGVYADGEFMEYVRLGRGRVHGDRVVRESGTLRYESILLPNGLREELTLEDYPAKLDGAAGALLAIESLLPGRRFIDGILGEEQIGDFHFRQGWAHAADGARVPVMRWAVKRGGLQRVYSGVPLAWLQGASYPVVIDPDFSGDSADAMIEGPNTSTSSVVSNGTYLVAVGGRTYNSAPHIWRSYFKFDTSTIGASSIVDQVNLRMMPENINAYVSWIIYVRRFNWGAYDPLSNTNRESAWDGLYAGPNDGSLASQSDSPGTHVTSANLSTSWVNKSGATYYGLWNNQEGYPFPNNQGAQHVYYTAESGTPSYRPLLIVEYTLGNPQPLPVSISTLVLAPEIAQYDTRVRLRASRKTTSLSTVAGRKDHE